MSPHLCFPQTKPRFFNFALSLGIMSSLQIQVGAEFRSGTLTLEVPPRQKHLLVLVQVGSFFTIVPLFVLDQCFWFKFSGPHEYDLSFRRSYDQEFPKLV